MDKVERIILLGSALYILMHLLIMKMPGTGTQPTTLRDNRVKTQTRTYTIPPPFPGKRVIERMIICAEQYRV